MQGGGEHPQPTTGIPASSSGPARAVLPPFLPWRYRKAASRYTSVRMGSRLFFYYRGSISGVSDFQPTKGFTIPNQILKSSQKAVGLRPRQSFCGSLYTVADVFGGVANAVDDVAGCIAHAAGYVLRHLASRTARRAAVLRVFGTLRDGRGGIGGCGGVLRHGAGLGGGNRLPESKPFWQMKVQSAGWHFWWSAMTQKTMPHPHFCCDQCGRFTTLPYDAELDKRALLAAGTMSRSHEVVFHRLHKCKQLKSRSFLKI